MYNYVVNYVVEYVVEREMTVEALSGKSWLL